MKGSWGHALTFTCLFLLTNFVNKYVLTVLKFQFPTIFQGWQTLVGFLMLSLLSSTQHLPQLMENISRSDVAHWLPGMMLFVGSIYSGSKALAKLSMPAFMSISNLVTVILCTAQLAVYRQLTSLFSYSMIMVVLITSLLIGKTDPNLQSKEGYFWMCLHVLALGFLGIFSRLMNKHIKLSAQERLYCNYLYSMLVLAPSSYFLGDAVQAGRYPYLYFSKFYMGCITSGVLGVFLSLHAIKLLDLHMDKSEISRVVAIAKLATSFASLFFFEELITFNHGLWIVVNHLAAMVCEDTASLDETTHLPVYQASQEKNKLTWDYIRGSEIES